MRRQIPAPKDRCISRLMQNYEKDAEPPLAEGETNVTVGASLYFECLDPYVWQSGSVSMSVRAWFVAVCIANS